MLNLRMYALERPQRGQRFFSRDLNFGLTPIFTSLHFLAKGDLLLKPSYLRKGIPISVSKARACSLFSAVVTIVIVKPRTLSTKS